MQTYCDLCTRHSTKETNLHLRFYPRFGAVICQECIDVIMAALADSEAEDASVIE